MNRWASCSWACFDRTAKELPIQQESAVNGLATKRPLTLRSVPPMRQSFLRRTYRIPHHRPCRCGAQSVVAPFALFRRARSGVRGTRRLQRVIQGRLPNLDSCSGLANIQVVGDMFLGPLQLPRGDHGLAPASSGGSQSRAGPVTDEIPLKLPLMRSTA